MPDLKLAVNQNSPAGEASHPPLSAASRYRFLLLDFWLVALMSQSCFPCEFIFPFSPHLSRVSFLEDVGV